MFAWFQRKPKIETTDALADFINAQAAFLVQKGIYEYASARAGHYSKVLFRESTFLEAVEVSRWSAFPLGLAMVAEVADNVLRCNTPALTGATAAVEAATLKVFDQYPVPDALEPEIWKKARAALVVQLAHLTLRAPKRALDVSRPYERTYFDLMPIHEKLRKPDFPTLCNYLRVSICNTHDELNKRLDAEALARQLDPK